MQYLETQENALRLFAQMAGPQAARDKVFIAAHLEQFVRDVNACLDDKDHKVASTTAAIMAQCVREGVLAGTVANDAGVKPEAVQAILGVEHALEHLRTKPGELSHQAAMLKWCREPATFLNRSTSGDDSGVPIRSEEGSHPMNNRHMLEVASMMPDECANEVHIPLRDPTEAETKAGRPALNQRDVYRTFTQLIPEEILKATARKLATEDANPPDWQAAEYWAEAERNANISPADKVPEWGNMPEAKRVAWWANHDPATLLAYMYPLARAQSTVAGQKWDVAGAAIAGVIEVYRMQAERKHPACVVHYLMFDVFNFRTKGVLLALLADGDVPLAISEHAAIKVQRLFSRPLAIQTSLSRALQDLHQNIPQIKHPSLLTGVKGSQGDRLLEGMSKAMNVGNAPGDCNGSRNNASGPNTSILSLLSADCPEREPCKQWEELGAALRSAFCTVSAMRMAKAVPAGGSALMEDLARAAEVLADAEPAREDQLRHTARMAAVASQLMGFCHSTQIEHVNAGSQPIINDIYENPQDGHAWALNESDSAAFTLACSVLMNTFPLYMHKRDLVSTGYVSTIYNMLNFAAVRRTVFTCPFAMSHDIKPHGPGCKCADKDELLSIWGAEPYRRMGAGTDTLIGIGMGAVSQGLDAAHSSAYVQRAYVSLARAMLLCINGDDECACMRVAATCRDMQRALIAADLRTLGRGGITAGLILKTEQFKDHGLVDCILRASNFLELNYARSADMASGATRPSDKKCFARTGAGRAPGTTIVYINIPLGRGHILKSISPSPFSALAKIRHRSLPGLVVHLFRELRLGALQEGLPDSLVAKFVSTMRRVIPNIQAAYERVTGQPTSCLFSGSMTLLTDPIGAAEEVARSSRAPAPVRALAAQGILVLPEAETVGDEYRRNDSLARWCLLMKGQFPTLADTNNYRAPQRLWYIGKWLAAGYYLSNIKRDLEHYNGKPALDLRGATARPVQQVSEVGRPLSSLPMIKLGTFALRPTPGCSDYEPRPGDGTRGLVRSVTMLPGGRILTSIMPAWGQVNYRITAARVSCSVVQDSALPWQRPNQAIDFALTELMQGSAITAHTSLALGFTTRGDRLDIRYTPEGAPDEDDVNVASACLRHAALRLGLSPGAVLLSGSAYLPRGSGAVLGSSEPFGQLRCTGGFYHGDMRHLMVAQLSVPHSGRGLLNRDVVKDMVQRRLDSPSGGAAVQHTWVSGQEIEVKTGAVASGAVQSWNSDDLNRSPGENLPSMLEVIGGGEYKVRYTPTEMQAALDFKARWPRWLYACCTALAASLRHRGSANTASWTIQTAEDGVAEFEVAASTAAGAAGLTLRVKAPGEWWADLGQVVSLATLYGAFCCAVLARDI